MERNGGITVPCNWCAMRSEFQCAAGGNAVIVSPGIVYRINFALGEYQYYGDHGHGIGASLEVAHSNNAYVMLLNRSSVALVLINKRQCRRWR